MEAFVARSYFETLVVVIFWMYGTAKKRLETEIYLNFGINYCIARYPPNVYLGLKGLIDQLMNSSTLWVPGGKSAFLHTSNQVVIKTVFLVLRSWFLAPFSNIPVFFGPSAEIVNILASFSKMADLVTIFFVQHKKKPIYFGIKV